MCNNIRDHFPSLLSMGLLYNNLSLGHKIGRLSEQSESQKQGLSSWPGSAYLTQFKNFPLGTCYVQGTGSLSN